MTKKSQLHQIDTVTPTAHEVITGHNKKSFKGYLSNDML